ncbi:hypothetical protein DIS24_g12028 [Lasiodiplodia hormozganensis]|uniref:Uncharacterized protein n=1 Tax=Lasiodiplodia hormozganensis TaxID=869390 RepID=A0AA39WAU6_9PEZI|nr:hypothetical protein DIS24_g12028 [Lasiodiplodia hormozganensis]
MASSNRDLQVTGDKLKTVLREQVVVGWLDKTTGRRRYLGRLGGADNTKANLTLHVRQDEAIERRLLINIHAPIKLHASTSERPRDMYLVIPTEQLSLTVHLVSDEVRPYICENHLKVRCDLGALAFVVMPVQRRKLQKPVTGVPAEILSCLQTLSETGDLDLYLRADDSVRCCLVDISSKLKNATTPAIDYSSIYPDGLRAAANCWSEYPRDEAHSSLWNPLVEDAPPRYDDAVASPLSGGDKVAFVRSTLSNGVERPPKRTAHEAFSGYMEAPLDSELTPTEVFPTQPDVHAAGNSHSGNDAAKDLHRSSAESLQERLRAAAAAPSPSDADTMFVCNSFPPPSPPFYPLPASVAGTTVSSVAATTVSVASGALSDTHPPAETVYSSPAPRSTTSALATTRELYLCNDLTELIFRTSKVLPKVHDDYLPQLLHLGFCAQECDARAFNAGRDALVRAVIQQCAAAPTSFAWTDNLEAHVEHVRRWMNKNLHRDADLRVLEDLVKLQAAALRTKAAPDELAQAVARETFDEERASCLANAFCIFGRKTWGQSSLVQDRF